jgi:hypothetical protein
MSAAQAALVGLAGALAAAADPIPVAVDREGSAPREAGSEPGIRVRPVSLARLGRSTREGAVLDLELLARVTVTGSSALDTTERLLVGLERDGRFVVEPVPHREAPPEGLAFGVRVRVPVRMSEEHGPPVLEPLQLDLRTARLLAGLVLDAEGRGVPDAVVRPAIGGRPVVTDAEGRFRLLAGDAAEQAFVVEVRGEVRTLQAATSAAPVVIRWE